MLADFAEVYREFISDDGRLRPAVVFTVPPDCVWSVDHDGLLMTTHHVGINDKVCLLSVLFAMDFGAAMAKHRQTRFPAKPGDYITVLRKLDEVTGQSGERYSRFIVNVTPAGSLAGNVAP